MESLKPLLLLTIALLLDTLGTVLFKHGSNMSVQTTQTGWRGHVESIIGTLKRKEISLGVVVYIIEYIVWIGFLSTTAVSIAYPLSSINIILILIASSLFLGEKVGKRRWYGALMIIVGVFLVGGTA
jgi:drug/metabolite transporter (DMT)-like permease